MSSVNDCSDRRMTCSTQHFDNVHALSDLNAMNSQLGSCRFARQSRIQRNSQMNILTEHVPVRPRLALTPPHVMTLLAVCFPKYALPQFW